MSTPDSETKVAPAKALLQNLALSAVAVGVTLGVFAGLDILAASITKASDGVAPNQNPHTAVVEYHHGLAPNKDFVVHWGDHAYSLVTNNLGLRDAEMREVPLKTEGERILFIGDSFTEASGVSYEESFVGVVADAVRGGNVEVLNAGVASYASIVYWKKTQYLLETVGLDVSHVVVMLDVSDIYDSTTYGLDGDGNVIKASFVKRVQEFVEQRTIAGRMISMWLYTHYQRFKYWNQNRGESEQKAKPQEQVELQAPIAINHHHALWTVNEQMFQEYGETGLRNEARNLAELAKLLKAKNVRMTLAVYPWPDQIWHKDFDSKHVSFWSAWSRDNGVEFVNLFPALFSKDTADARKAIEKNFIAGDVHWNVAGHQAVAAQLLKSLTIPGFTATSSKAP